MDFNKAQQMAVEHGEGAMLVLAGPGSGKTAVITERVRYLVEKRAVPPEKILVITFSRAAAVEMKKRFERLTSHQFSSVNFGTFHAVFFNIIKNESHYDNSSIIKEEERYSFIRERIHALRIETDRERELIEQISSSISAVKGESVKPEEVCLQLCEKSEFEAIFKAYNEYLAGEGKLDFDDMMTVCLKLFKNDPKCLKTWQEKYRYILIDEFQDINALQYRLIKLLAKPEDNIFAVGDDDQSIYGFRGAKPDIMFEFEKDFKGCKRILLGVNYRSHSEIIATAVNLVKHNKKRFEKSFESNPGKGGICRYLRFETMEEANGFIVGKLREILEDGKTPEELEASGNRALTEEREAPGNRALTEEREASGNRAMTEVRKESERRIHREEREKRQQCNTAAGGRRKLRDVAVLFRMRQEVAGLHRMLVKANIPCRLGERIPCIFDHMIAEDMIAYLRLARGEHRRAELIRVINRPNRYVTRQSIQAAGYMAGKIDRTPGVEELLAANRDREYVREKLEHLLRQLKFIKDLDVRTAIRFIRKAIGYDEWLKDYAKERSVPYTELEEIAGELESSAEGCESLGNWLDVMEDYRSRIKEKKPEDGVALMTFHSSKGLEFETVFIIDLVEGCVPSNRAKTEEQIEEERRTLYVALTRAKRELYILSSRERLGRMPDESRFVREMKLTADKLQR